MWQKGGGKKGLVSHSWQCQTDKTSSVTRFGTILPLWLNFEGLWQCFWSAYVLFGRILNVLYENFYAIVKIIFVVNGQILRKKQFYHPVTLKTRQDKENRERRGDIYSLDKNYKCIDLAHATKIVWCPNTAKYIKIYITYYAGKYLSNVYYKPSSLRHSTKLGWRRNLASFSRHSCTSSQSDRHDFIAALNT